MLIPIIGTCKEGEIEPWIGIKFVSDGGYILLFGPSTIRLRGSDNKTIKRNGGTGNTIVLKYRPKKWLPLLVHDDNAPFV